MKHSFFEGWNLKLRNGENSIAFIPAYHIDKYKTASCSLQVLTKERNYYIPYPFSALEVHPKYFDIRLGEMHISEAGLMINLSTPDLSIKGKIQFGAFTPLHSDIMGPFSHIPWLQCRHGVISMAHSLKGTLTVNQKEMDFTGGIGYAEKDQGYSFPQSYLWSQCNWHNPTDNKSNSIMVSLAHIPFPFHDFTGCICAIWYNGKEYRLATYHHVKILAYTKSEIILEQGNYLLQINLLEEKPHPLKAPVNGIMKRSIVESLCSCVRYQFFIRHKKVFDIVSHDASFEFSTSL